MIFTILEGLGVPESITKQSNIDQKLIFKIGASWNRFLMDFGKFFEDFWMIFDRFLMSPSAVAGCWRSLGSGAPAGCSCVGSPCKSFRKLKTPGANNIVPLRRTFYASGLQFGSSWLILLVLSSMFDHFVQPGSYLAPTWSIFAPTWLNLAPTWPNLVPSWPNLAPTWSNFRPNSVQHVPNLLPRSPTHIEYIIYL